MATIRLATPADAQGILDIYAPYIEHTSFTFETETPSVQAFAERIQTYLLQWPWLICEINGKIAGYAYAAKHRERTAYQWCVESSVYIHDDFLKAGIASALYTALLKLLALQGYYNVYAVINLPNDRSVAFHEKMGFEFFANYKNVGYKLGKWKTVGWWQLVLHEYIDEPAAPIPFANLNPKIVQTILPSPLQLKQ